MEATSSVLHIGIGEHFAPRMMFKNPLVHASAFIEHLLGWQPRVRELEIERPAKDRALASGLRAWPALRAASDRE